MNASVSFVRNKYIKKLLFWTSDIENGYVDEV